MSRSITKTVTVGASPDAVFRMLTEAEELVRWFPVDARVAPGVGGSIWLSWGGGTEGAAPITAWEDGRHLQWTESRGPAKLAVDFHLEAAAGGGTIVRLVNSGFGAGPDWDDEFHMTNGGWQYFLEHLRVYVDHHCGKPRDLISFRDTVPFSHTGAFARLIGADGLSRDRALEQCPAGGRYETSTAHGDRISGVVLSASPETGQMGLTIEQLEHAVLFLEMEPAKTGTRAGFWLSTYGLPASDLEAARQRFRKVYDGALGTIDNLP